MGHYWSWKSGEWTVYCQVCGKSLFASEAQKRWDGLIVCSDDYETRHPQDLIKVRHEDQSVPFSRPRKTPIYVEVSYIETGT